MEHHTEGNEIHSDICSNVLSKFSCNSVLVRNAKDNEKVGLFSTFSGQGVDTYFDELNAMFSLHHNKISSLVNSADQMFRRQLETPEAR
jgi:DNA-binding transcriptional regulator WhiA